MKRVRFLGKRLSCGGYTEEMVVAEVVECGGLRFLLADCDGAIVSFDYLTGTELLRSHDRDMAKKFLTGAAEDRAYLNLLRGRIKEYGAVELFDEEPGPEGAEFFHLDGEYCYGNGAASGTENGDGSGAGQFLLTGRGASSGYGYGCGTMVGAGDPDGCGNAQGMAGSSEGCDGDGEG